MRTFLLLPVLLVLLGGCENEAVKKCHADMSTAQAALLAMDPKDRPSVEAVLGMVEGALKVCGDAKRTDEIKDLTDAKNNLSGHVDALKKRAERSAPHALTPKQLEKLIKDGDPACPKGHAYEHGDSKKLIQCTGPQLFQMNFAQASEHYGRRGFTVAVDPSGKILRAEFGAEVVIFRFVEPKSTHAAACLSLTAAPGIAWQEVVTRATGVPPQKLTEGKTLVLGGVTVPFRLEGPGPDKTVHLGDCPPKPAAP